MAIWTTRSLFACLFTLLHHCAGSGENIGRSQKGLQRHRAAIHSCNGPKDRISLSWQVVEELLSLNFEHNNSICKAVAKMLHCDSVSMTPFPSREQVTRGQDQDRNAKQEKSKQSPLFPLPQRRETLGLFSAGEQQPLVFAELY